MLKIIYLATLSCCCTTTEVERACDWTDIFYWLHFWLILYFFIYFVSELASDVLISVVLLNCNVFEFSFDWTRSTLRLHLPQWGFPLTWKVQELRRSGTSWEILLLVMGIRHISELCDCCFYVYFQINAKNKTKEKNMKNGTSYSGNGK